MLLLPTYALTNEEPNAWCYYLGWDYGTWFLESSSQLLYDPTGELESPLEKFTRIPYGTSQEI